MKKKICYFLYKNHMVLMINIQEAHNFLASPASSAFIIINV